MSPRARGAADGAGQPRWSLEGVPRRPGVYLFRNRKGRVLYVGKARDLRATSAPTPRRVPFAARSPICTASFRCATAPTR